MNALAINLAATREELGDWAVGVPLRIVLTAIGAWILVRLSRRMIRRLLRTLTMGPVQETLGAVAGPSLANARLAQRIDALSAVAVSGAAVVIWLMAAFIMLDQVGISLAPLLAGAGVAGIALGFGAQSLVRDFLTGAFILIEDQFAVGDIIDAGEATGEVEAISLRTTRLRSVDGVVWHIPNGEIRRVGNMSQHWSRALIDVEVSYDTDITKAKEVIGRVAADLCEQDEHVLDDPEVWGVEELGASAVVIRVVIKTTPSEQWAVSRRFREMLKNAFDDAGIEIPFPQQTVWTRPDPPTGPS